MHLYIFILLFQSPHQLDLNTEYVSKHQTTQDTQKRTFTRYNSKIKQKTRHTQSQE